MSAAEVDRTKEGVPRWDGSANTFTAYEEACYLYEAGTADHKKSLCGPRLISELSGAAKRMVAGKHPVWVSRYDGVRILLEFLRQCLGKPQIPEMTEHLTRYFKSCRRKAQEPMNEYITRKAEAYLRAEQALQRVVASQKKASSATTSTSSPSGAHGWGEPWSGWSSRRNSVESTTDTPGDGDEAPTEGPSEATTRDTWTDWRSQASSWSWSGSYYGSGYGGTYWDWNGYRSPQTWQTKWTEEPRTELLPSFVQGWYLLQDANLSQTERNLVQTALGGSYEVDKVAQELRNQWSDSDVRHREQGRQAGYMGDHHSDGEDPAEEPAGSLGGP